MIVHEFGFKEFRRDLERAEEEIGQEVEKVTEVALAKMKKAATKTVKAANLDHLKHLTRSYDYEVSRDRDVVSGEVGALESRKNARTLNYRQGSLDWIAEYGTARYTPVPHWRPAADAELPIWERHLGDVAERGIDAA